MSIDHIDHQDYYYHKARHAELLRRSETVYLVDQAMLNRPRHKGISYHILGWLGQHLVVWGRQLQERYGSNYEALDVDSSHISW
jgi:hemerythrin